MSRGRGQRMDAEEREGGEKFSQRKLCSDLSWILSIDLLRVHYSIAAFLLVFKLRWQRGEPMAVGSCEQFVETKRRGNTEAAASPTQ